MAAENNTSEPCAVSDSMRLSAASWRRQFATSKQTTMSNFRSKENGDSKSRAETKLGSINNFSGRHRPSRQHYDGPAQRRTVLRYPEPHPIAIGDGSGGSKTKGFFAQNSATARLRRLTASTAIYRIL